MSRHPFTTPAIDVFLVEYTFSYRLASPVPSLCVRVWFIPRQMKLTFSHNEKLTLLQSRGRIVLLVKPRTGPLSLLPRWKGCVNSTRL